MSVLTIKQANKTIKLISEAGRKLDQRIHDVAVSGLAHFLQHGDTTLISELCHAMPRSARGNALKFWMTKHSRNGIKWNAKAHNGKGGWTKAKNAPELSSWEKLAIITVAMKEPFYLKEEKEPSVWNERAAVLSLVKKLKEFSEEHELSPEGLAIIQAVG